MIGLLFSGFGNTAETGIAIKPLIPSACYHLKVTLKDISPAVWRRFVVPNDFRLDRLHDIIQIVMGWSDSHLHEFEFKGGKYSEDVRGVPGYGEFLKTIANPKHPEQKTMLKWAEGATGRKGIFKPNRFDAEEITREILKYLRWSRDRG